MTRRNLLSAAALAPTLLQAQKSEPPRYQSLFDGQSLQGWSIQEGPESAFYVDDGAIVVHEGSNFPTWLRSRNVYSNFDFLCDFFVKGWCNSGVYLHAPEHGRNTSCGLKVNLFHQQDSKPRPESVGSIFPLVPPSHVNVKNKGEWNTLRIRLVWPQIEVWINGEQVQNLDLNSVPDLKYRLRSGYIGFESLSYPIRFRNIKIQELPGSDDWSALYETRGDFSKWTVAQGNAIWQPLGSVLRADNTGYLATKEKYRDFAFQCYIRGSKHHNGGIIFRAQGTDSNSHYEIQLHDVEGAVYPTGSLYHFQRAIYPRIEPEQWYLFQLFVKDRDCLVRINGETVVDYHNLEKLDAGPIMIQAHQANRWIEYKQMRIRPL